MQLGCYKPVQGLGQRTEAMAQQKMLKCIAGCNATWPSDIRPYLQIGSSYACKGPCPLLNICQYFQSSEEDFFFPEESNHK